MDFVFAGVYHIGKQAKTFNLVQFADAVWPHNWNRYRRFTQVGDFFDCVLGLATVLLAMTQIAME
jgi:hypothetical protein